MKIALLRFGKLVLEPTGAVHFDAGYAVTYKTPDFVGNGKCLPDALPARRYNAFHPKKR